MPIKKILYLIAGTLCIAVGIIGVILPGIPTTGPLLLAAWCYARGSDRWYNWLINHRFFGRYIRTYREHKAMPLKAKIWAIGVMWPMIGVSVFLLNGWILRGIVALLGVLGTWFILRIPTLRLQALSDKRGG